MTAAQSLLRFVFENGGKRQKILRFLGINEIVDSCRFNQHTVVINGCI